MGQIVLYEGNGGSQDIVDVFEDKPGLNARPAQNDEARSLKLLAVRPGTIVTVYDSPDGRLNDDFCVIHVRKHSTEYTVGTFERSYSDEYVSVSYAAKNGLDGKVSRIRIDWDGEGSLGFRGGYGYNNDTTNITALTRDGTTDDKPATVRNAAAAVSNRPAGTRG